MNPLPMIWVGALGAYNAGTLHGEWIELDGMNDGDLEDAVQRIVDTSPEPGDEEWFIADHSGFCGIPVGEYDTLEHTLDIANKIVEFGHGATTALVDAYGAQGALLELESGATIVASTERQPGQYPAQAIADAWIAYQHEEVRAAIEKVLRANGVPYATELSRCWTFDNDQAGRDLAAGDLAFGEDDDYTAYAFQS